VGNLPAALGGRRIVVVCICGRPDAFTSGSSPGSADAAAFGTPEFSTDGPSYETCRTPVVPGARRIERIGPGVISGFFPASTCRVGSPVTTRPPAGRKCGISVISVWSPPTSSHGSQNR
jgi:hypothetical protein